MAACLKHGIQALTVFAFSSEVRASRLVDAVRAPCHIAASLFVSRTKPLPDCTRARERTQHPGAESSTTRPHEHPSQNWDRDAGEVSALMRLMESAIRGNVRELADRGVRLKFAGERGRLPVVLHAAMQAAEAATEGGERLLLTVAVSYGSRSDIVSAARVLAARCRGGELDPGDIDEGMLAGQMSTSEVSRRSLRLLPGRAALLWAHIGRIRLRMDAGGGSGSPDPYLWGAETVQLHALGGRLRRAVVHAAFLVRARTRRPRAGGFCCHLMKLQRCLCPLCRPDFSADDFEAALDAYQERERRFGRRLSEGR